MSSTRPSSQHQPVFILIITQRQEYTCESYYCGIYTTKEDAMNQLIPFVFKNIWGCYDDLMLSLPEEGEQLLNSFLNKEIDTQEEEDQIQKEIYDYLQPMIDRNQEKGEHILSMVDSNYQQDMLENDLDWKFTIFEDFLD